MAEQTLKIQMRKRSPWPDAEWSSWYMPRWIDENCDTAHTDETARGVLAKLRAVYGSDPCTEFRLVRIVPEPD